MTKHQADELHFAALEKMLTLVYVPGTTRKWAKTFVEAEKRIPESMRDDFINELTHQDPEYRKALEESVRWFGVRWGTT
jgi:hypothetical protein